VVPLHARRFSGHSATLPDDGILRDESAFEGSCLDGTCMFTLPNGKAAIPRIPRSSIFDHHMPSAYHSSVRPSVGGSPCRRRVSSVSGPLILLKDRSRVRSFPEPDTCSAQRDRTVSTQQPPILPSVFRDPDSSEPIPGTDVRPLPYAKSQNQTPVGRLGTYRMETKLLSGMDIVRRRPIRHVPTYSRAFVIVVRSFEEL
jgi:hypothetical protein